MTMLCRYQLHRNFFPSNYYIGIERVADRPELRTMGGRKPPMVNFDDESGPQTLTSGRCVEMTISTDADDEIDDSSWHLATCTLAVNDRYICMTAEGRYISYLQIIEIASSLDLKR